MDTIRVVHLSDIHFSEKDFWGVSQVVKPPVPHRSGHNPKLLLALDEILKKVKWDLMVISGDLSRVGMPDSFLHVKNWLFGQIHVPGGGEIGLKLNEAEKRCFVVPGNHDSFNGEWMQHSLSNYESYFPHMSGRSVERTRVRDTDVNVLLYDSTDPNKGGFARGYLAPTVFRGWKTDERTLDLAVIHHHLAQDPCQRRQRTLELKNAHLFLAFLLSKHVNGVLFGHTHDSFFEKISADILRDQIMYRRKVPRLLRQILPKFFNRPDADSLSFDRIATKSGRYPSFDKYFEYLYIKNILGKSINGPDIFEEPRHFYDHIKSYRSDYKEKLHELKKRKVAFSMAPSPTYAGLEENGFHILNFSWDGEKFLYGCERYFWDGAEFTLRQEA
jgi:3',5'-cyclic AMP phosphodiesterase CpdA